MPRLEAFRDGLDPPDSGRLVPERRVVVALLLQLVDHVLFREQVLVWRRHGSGRGVGVVGREPAGAHGSCLYIRTGKIWLQSIQHGHGASKPAWLGPFSISDEIARSAACMQLRVAERGKAARLKMFNLISRPCAWAAKRRKRAIRRPTTRLALLCRPSASCMDRATVGHRADLLAGQRRGKILPTSR